jgi:hypothetical protein
MRLLRPASEDEMVAVFLTAEAASERYAPQIRQILAGSGNRVASSSIPIPAIRRPTRCAGGSWPPTRAYPAGDVFTGMPADVTWHQAGADPGRPDHRQVHRLPVLAARPDRGGKGNLMTDLTDLTRFTDGSIAGRQERLPDPLRELHRAVLRRFFGQDTAIEYGRLNFGTLLTGPA